MTETKRKLTPFRAWMVASNLQNIANGMPANRVIAQLRVNGYSSIADEVEAQFEAKVAQDCRDLLQALKDLTKEVSSLKLNVRKDFSLMNAHACALKTMHRIAEGNNDHENPLSN